MEAEAGSLYLYLYIASSLPEVHADRAGYFL